MRCSELLHSVPPLHLFLNRPKSQGRNWLSLDVCLLPAGHNPSRSLPWEQLTSKRASTCSQPRWPLSPHFHMDYAESRDNQPSLAVTRACWEICLDNVLNPGRHGPWPSFSPHAPLTLQVHTCAPGGKSLNLHYDLISPGPWRDMLPAKILNLYRR